MSNNICSTVNKELLGNLHPLSGKSGYAPLVVHATPEEEEDV